MFSYSKLDTYDQCPLRYRFKYVDKKRSNIKTLPLEIGTTSHYGMELIGKNLIDGTPPDYDLVKNVFINGASHEEVLGAHAIKEKYFFEWTTRNEKSGLTYDEKVQKYYEQMTRLEQDSTWHPIAVELNFEFQYYRPNYFLHGFIDRVDENENGDLKIVDYKSSNQTYIPQKLATPLQMYIYTLACLDIYKKMPKEHEYDFIFLGEKQKACTKGYEQRGKKKLDKLFAAIEESKAAGVYRPKPTPLCHWCEYSGNTVSKDTKCNGMCSYYSLWTPQNKTYSVNKKFENKTENKKEGFWF